MRARHQPELPFGSFADALSGMLFVFILTTFWFAWQLAQATEELEKERKRVAEEREKAEQQKLLAQQQIETILKARELAVELTQESDKRKWSLTRCLGHGGWVDPRPSPNEPRIFLYLKGVEWFEPSQAALDTPARTQGADDIRRCIGELLNEDRVENYSIRVYLEGHTDSDPIVGSDESNWELSGRRSAAVVRHVLNGSIRDALAQERLEVIAVGMADLRPAWQRLCELDEPVDRDMCTRLRGGEKLSLETMSRWANRPQDRTEAGSKRRGYLRRVDLRLELLPRITGEGA
jgi:flagellar motor protein MotB